MIFGLADTTAVLPSILPGINLDGALPIDLVSSLLTPTATAINPLRETTMQPHVIISTAITGCLVIVVFVMVVTCSLVCVIRKRRRSLDHPTGVSLHVRAADSYKSRYKGAMVMTSFNLLQLLQSLMTVWNTITCTVQEMQVKVRWYLILYGYCCLKSHDGL